MLVAPHVQTTHYGKHSFKPRSINVWNMYQKNLKTDLTCDFSKLKKPIFSVSFTSLPATSLMKLLSNQFINI